MLKSLKRALVLIGLLPLTRAAAGAPKKTTNAADDIASVIASAEEALASFQETQTKSQRVLKEVEQTKQQILQLQRQHADVLSQTKQVEALIRQVNAKQLEQLANELRVIREKEMKRRRSEKIAEIGGVTPEEMEAMMDPNVMFAESEALLEKWVEEIIQEEIENLTTKATEAEEIEQQEEDGDKEVVGDGGCRTTPSEAANLVMEALNEYANDGIGLKDHAQGATIVHEMTSDTYQPPPDSNDLLGNVWWRKYIAEDWEALLPEGWEEWDASVPSWLSHSFGLKWSATAPPEAVLHSHTLPGSCWPMQGSSGFVTFALPYPVDVFGISIDHASKLLLTDREEQLKSAPRHVKIIGYPPCQDDCAGLSFDVHDEIVLTEVEYDIEGSRVQTFDVEWDGEEEDPAEDWAVVAAVKVEVVENWGNEDYGCLYRVRVHGEPIIDEG